MAFFKFRKSSAEPVQPKAQTPNIETLRQRAKYRLAGATVLIMVAVIALPLLFDKQPRPLAVDTPIEIPERNKVLPLVVPAPPATTAKSANLPAASKTTSASDAPVAAGSAAANPVNARKDAPTPAGTASVTAAPLPPPAKLAATMPAEPPVVVNRAQALLDGQEVATPTSQRDPSAAASQRVVVQVGAFADAARAQEVRWKIEKTGLKTYTQVADTKDGKRIRVRVGPFATRAEAEKAAARIKKLDLPAVLLAL